MSNGTPLRRAVSSLERTGGRRPQELVDYAEGIRRMKALDADDPRSLSFQAAIHGRDGEPDSQNPDWDQCQHQSWFFLPWHRMYLVEFERIIGSLIDKQDWRLPYWDYNADSSLASSSRWNVPPEFLDPPDPNANPLFVQRRKTKLTKEEREWETALRAREFASPANTMVANGFGGGEIAAPQQFGGARTGTLEGQPHNTVHRIIGGLMGNPFSAGFDPLFWLHHANIDRLWEVWLKQGRRNPRLSSWLDTSFSFPTADGGRETRRISEVVKTEPLGYAYDDTTPPPPPVRRELRRRVTPIPGPETVMEETPDATPAAQPELIGATEAPVSLDQGVTLSVGLERPANWGLTRRIEESVGGLESTVDVEAMGTEAALEGEVWLQLENVRGLEPSVGVYRIYVNVPESEDPDDHPELRVGLFSTFGLEAASAQGQGMTQAFDITDVARQLYSEGRWDPENVKLSLVPHADVDDREATPNEVTVDRIAVYVVPGQ